MMTMDDDGDGDDDDDDDDDDELGGGVFIHAPISVKPI